ncbi:hypothetical protein K0M31_020378 [Melipona bicolor]|uniref:Uncharacterized protein n=1 Tax=Melipona bicolor TaxID=60889 RepID=A0AA40G1C3_9HYME|nr:hypothetical protein K0M31_020378 [Melipona bicolor]
MVNCNIRDYVVASNARRSVDTKRMRRSFAKDAVIIDSLAGWKSVGKETNHPGRNRGSELMKRFGRERLKDPDEVLPCLSMTMMNINETSRHTGTIRSLLCGLNLDLTNKWPNETCENKSDLSSSELNRVLARLKRN